MLKHRDKLLADIAQQLPKFQRSSVIGILVTFYQDDFKMVEFFGLEFALDAISNGLYYDAEHDWSEANRAELSIY
jgi:hypothetical protein